MLKAIPTLFRVMMLTDQFWLSCSENLSLLDNDVHVWRAWLNYPPEQVDYLATILSEDEHVRAERFHYAKDRSRFIIERAILKTLLGRYLALPPNDVAFTYNQYGKPNLEEDINQIGFQFNLSHSHELVIYAFTRNRILGIDLEYQRWLPDLKELAVKCFSQAEFEKWDNLPSIQQQETFFLYWTQKEAYLKAKGYGLLQPLNSIEVTLEPEVGAQLEYVEHSYKEEVCRWSYVSLIPAPGYVASLFVSGNSWQLNRREFAWAV